MADLLFKTEDALRIYKIYRSNDGQIKISVTHRQDGFTSSFHISRSSLDGILAAPDQYAAAATVCTEARLKRDARRASRAGYSHERQ